MTNRIQPLLQLMKNYETCYCLSNFEKRGRKNTKIGIGNKTRGNAVTNSTVSSNITTGMDDRTRNRMTTAVSLKSRGGTAKTTNRANSLNKTRTRERERHREREREKLQGYEQQQQHGRINGLRAQLTRLQE